MEQDRLAEIDYQNRILCYKIMEIEKRNDGSGYNSGTIKMPK